MAQKITWMQLLIIGLISSIFLSACEKKVDNQIISDYIFSNQSNHTIQLHCFFAGIDSTYSLNKSNTFKISEDLMTGASFIIVRADSVKVVYDSIKYQIFNRISNDGVLNLNNYDYTEITKNHHEYTFIFNEEMYNNANHLK